MQFFPLWLRCRHKCIYTELFTVSRIWN